MSHKKYASPLRLELEKSSVLLALVVIAHAGAVAMLVICEFYWITKLLLALTVFISLYLFMSLNGKVPMFKFVRRMFPEIKSIVWGHDDLWMLTTAQGEELQARLLTSTFVHPKLTTVNLKLSGMPWYKRYRSFVFMQDNLDAETFRRLRVRLLWYSMPDQDSLGATK